MKMISKRHQRRLYARYMQELTQPGDQPAPATGQEGTAQLGVSGMDPPLPGELANVSIKSELPSDEDDDNVDENSEFQIFSDVVIKEEMDPAPLIEVEPAGIGPTDAQRREMTQEEKLDKSEYW